MKHSQTSISNSRWLRPALLAVVAAIVTAGCKTQAITPPGGAGMPTPPSSGGMPAPSGGSSGSSGDSSDSSGGSTGSSGGSTGSSGGSSDGSSTTGDSGSMGGSDGSAGSVGSMPQIEMPGGFPGAGAGGDGDGDADADGDSDGDSNSDCGDTGELPGGVGGMGQAGECLGGGGGSDNDSDSETASGSGGEGGGGVAGTGGAGGIGQFPAESGAERAARLGRELEESVGGFDEVLLEEQREIAAVGRNTEGFGGSGSGSGSGGGISLGDQSAGGSSGGSVTVANRSAPTRESPIAGMSDQEIRERTPDDIPVTVDDDIISRQLREAALAEEDPELRERLWVEYRKYKDL